MSTPDEYEDQDDEGPAGKTMAWTAPAQPRAAVPFQSGPPTILNDIQHRSDNDDPDERHSGTVALDKPVTPPATPLPFQSANGYQLRAQRVGLPPPPPAYVRPAVSASPIAPQVKASPWGGAGGSFSSRAESARSLDTRADGNAARAGVAAASDAAASMEARQVAPRQTEVKPKPAIEIRPAPKESVKLLYFDPLCIERVRRHDEWRIVLAEYELRRLEQGRDEDKRAPENDRVRRDIYEVMLRGKPVGPEALRSILSRGFDEDGHFEAPLVLATGELELPFDELSALKATVAIVRPITGGDKRLSDVLDAQEDLAKMPWLEGSNGIADGLRERIREVFVSAKRVVSWDYVDAHVERMLLERRCYQARTLWGKKWIRALMRMPNGIDVPVYVPDAQREELPLFKRFRARILGEVEGKEDRYESSEVAVKVVGLGRVASHG
jgi:hypothetical protein